MRYTKAALKIYIKNYFISFPKIDLPNVKFKSCENNTFILNISCVCVCIWNAIKLLLLYDYRFGLGVELINSSSEQCIHSVRRTAVHHFHSLLIPQDKQTNVQFATQMSFNKNLARNVLRIILKFDDKQFQQKYGKIA